MKILLIQYDDGILEVGIDGEIPVEAIPLNSGKVDGVSTPYKWSADDIIRWVIYLTAGPLMLWQVALLFIDLYKRFKEWRRINEEK